MIILIKATSYKLLIFNLIIAIDIYFSYDLFNSICINLNIFKLIIIIL